MLDPYLYFGWLATYFVHSTLLLVFAFSVLRCLPSLGHGTQERLLRVAFFGGLDKNTSQTTELHLVQLF